MPVRRASTRSTPARYAPACAVRLSRPRTSRAWWRPRTSCSPIYGCSGRPVAASTARAWIAKQSGDFRRFELAPVTARERARQRERADARAQHAHQRDCLALDQLADVVAAGTHGEQAIPAVAALPAGGLELQHPKRRA